MISRLKWSKWDWFIILALALVALFLFAGDSGVALWVKQGFHWFSAGMQWVLAGATKLVNSIAK